MKRLLFFLVPLLGLSSFVILASLRNQPAGHPVQRRSGTAVIMTGAAARIPQEAALLEELWHRGMLKDVVFISGVSSGALNAVMLNGILSGRISWEEYRTILYSLKNSDVYVQEGKKLPVNTAPLRHFLTAVVEKKLGYKTIGDLPYMTEISFTHIRELEMKKTVYRMCSRPVNQESDTTLSLVDILMASASFPLAFPPSRIRNVKTIPDEEFIDGGIGDDHVPFKALLDFEKYRGEGVARVYFISRKSDSIPEISEELRVLGIDDRGRFDRLGISVDNIFQKGINRRLLAFSKQAPDLVPLSYVWIPGFPERFLMFSFSDLKRQYEITFNWAKDHSPVPLKVYLEKSFPKK